MDILAIDKLVLFILFVIPGFISIKTYDLLVPGDIRKASDSVVEAIAYSCVNYAVFSWLVIILFRPNFSTESPILFALAILFLLLIAPILLTCAVWKIRHTRILRRLIRHPVPKPWDYVFSKGDAYWTILELHDGQRIGGIYDAESFASSFPNDEQIYIEEAWEIDGHAFIRPINRSKGLIVSGRDIKVMEIYR